MSGILGGDPAMFAALFVCICATVSLVGWVFAATFRGER